MQHSSDSASSPVNKRRLHATVTLQNLTPGRHIEPLATTRIDVTDVLGCSADDLLALIEDFDGDGAPYLERLPCAEAEALSVAHGGPSEVGLSFIDFFAGLGLLGEDDDAENAASWLNEAFLERTRQAIGWPLPAPQSGDSRTFEIGGRWAVVAFWEGWTALGSYVSASAASRAAAALGRARVA